MKKQVVIPKTWRSELTRVVVFLVLSGLSIYLTKTFPKSIISGPLFHIGSYGLYLSLPLFWFLPCMTALSAIYRIYNVRFAIDKKGIEAKVGILSLHQRIIRVRFEDVRSVEMEQSILERALDIGTVEVATAATGDVEIYFEGVGAPREVQNMIQAERDKRARLRQKQYSDAREEMSA